MRHCRNLLFMCLVLGFLGLIHGCGTKPPPPPPPPDPTRVSINIEAAADSNPSPEGRASPVSLRIYQFKSLSDFNKADFISLYQKDTEALGSSVAGKEEVLLKPGEKKAIAFEAANDVQAIGFLVLFRDYEQAQWKATAPVAAHKQNQITVSISGTSIAVK